jgi:oxygen-independent coproporphyrinogen-3 oxidase
MSDSWAERVREVEAHLRSDGVQIHAVLFAPVERARETMAVQLRRASGIDRAALQTQTQYRLDEIAGEKVWTLVPQGLLEDDGNRVRLTRQGKYVADAVIQRLL